MTKISIKYLKINFLLDRECWFTFTS